MPRLTSLVPAVLLAIALAAAGCSRAPDAPAAAAGPDQAVKALIVHARANDYPALAKAALPPEAYQRVQTAWRESLQAAPAGAAEREHYAEVIARLTAPDAEQALYAQLEPTLVRLEGEMAAQLPLATAMATGFASAAVQENAQLDADQKQHANAVIGALAGWVATASWADRGKARAAIGVLVDTARGLQLDTLDAVQALDLDAYLSKLGQAGAGLKRILVLYGLDLDASLDGAQVELLAPPAEAQRPEAGEAERAQVRVTYPLAGNSISTILAMRRVDGLWYPEALLEANRNWLIEPAPQAAPAPEPTAKAGTAPGR